MVRSSIWPLQGKGRVDAVAPIADPGLGRSARHPTGDRVGPRAIGDATGAVGRQPKPHFRFQPCSVAGDNFAIGGPMFGIVRVVAQKSSKSAKVRTTSISRVSILSRPAPAQRSRSASIRDASAFGA